MRHLITLLFSVLTIVTLQAQDNIILWSTDQNGQMMENNSNFNLNDIKEYTYSSLADTCLSVDTFYYTEKTQTTIKLKWEEGDETTLTYIFRYRKLGAADYTYKVISDTKAELTGLKECEEYQVGISSVCLQDTSGFKQILFRTDCANSNRNITVNNSLISPNPIHSSLEINLVNQFPGDYRINIINTLGQVVYKNTVIKNELQKSFKITLSDELKPGMYILYMETGSDQIFSKFLKI